MKSISVKKYLKKPSVLGRWTTFNGTLQGALSIPEVYDPARHAAAVRLLGQDPTADLTCVYCDAPAATWDHLTNVVQNGRYSGHGHRIHNLVPACRTCNESKGSKPWRTFIEEARRDDSATRIARLAMFASQDSSERFDWERIKLELPDQSERYDQLIRDIRSKLQEAEELAIEIRNQIAARSPDGPKAELTSRRGAPN